jgi:hypothetical protein
VTAKKSQGQDATAPVEPIAEQPQTVAAGKLLVAMSAPMYAPVGEHKTVRLEGKIEDLLAPEGANAVVLQAIRVGIRYTLDGSEPGPKHGFRLDESAPVLLPASGTIRVVEAKPGAMLEVQFVRMV